jgi:hypothetical protein
MCALTVPQRGFFSRELVLDEAGIRRGKKQLVAWDEVDHYRYDWHDWTHPGDLVVVSSTREVIRIAPFFDQWQNVAEHVLDELHRRLRADPWFEPFMLEGDALVHSVVGRLPLAELEHVELAPVGSSVVVFVHARNGSEWSETDVSQIANLWLWLEMLSERGVAIRSPLALHLPPVLDTLGDWIRAEDRMPRATVVRKG